MRSGIYYCGRRKACGGECLPRQERDRERVLQGWWVFAYSSGLRFQLRDKRSSGIPSDGNHLGFEQPQGATGGPPRRGHGRRCSLHTEVSLSRRLGTPRHPPRPEIGVCLLKGEGGPASLPMPEEGSPPARGPAPRAAPAPARPTAEPGEKSGLGPEAGKAGRVGQVRTPGAAPELPT